MNRVDHNEWEELFDNLGGMSAHALPAPTADQDERIRAEAPRANPAELATAFARRPAKQSFGLGAEGDDDLHSRLA